MARYSYADNTVRVTAVLLCQGIDLNLYALFALIASGCCRQIEGNQ